MLDEKYALITGAGSGIGKELAREFIKKRANIIITDIDEKRLQEVAKELEQDKRKSSQQIQTYCLDHTKEDLNIELESKYFANFSRIDFLCLNAGVGIGGDFLNHKFEDFQKMMNVNYFSNVSLLQSFLLHMKRQKSGHIMFTASLAGLLGIPMLSAYSASKFAMVGLAESIRAELAQDNISVSVLCPGLVKTNIAKDSTLRTNSSETKTARNNALETYAKYGASASEIAKDGMKGMLKKQAIITSPFSASFLHGLKRTFPDVFAFTNELLANLTKEKLN